jgi:1-acyl-sn-glycerol-3-phosphate acyltransferase
MLISIFVFLVIVALSLPSAVIFIPLAMLTGNARPLYAVGCAITRVGLRAAGIRVLIEGSEQIPKDRACIFMSNHVSNLDPPVLISRLPGRTSVFLKRSLMKIPILGYAFKLGGFVPVDRSGNVHDAKASVAAAAHVLAQGLHITTFVEGTRSKTGRLLPFKKGPFYLAKETGAPCIPVSIYGTESLMAKGSFAIKPGTVHIVFHAPIEPRAFETRDGLLTAVRASIASGLPEWMRG